MKTKHYRFLLPLFLFLLIFGLSSCAKPERPRLVIGENPINETAATSSLALATTTSEIQQQTEPPVEEIEVNTRIPLTIPVVSGYAVVKEKIPVLDIYASPDSDSIYSEGLTNPGKDWDTAYHQFLYGLNQNRRFMNGKHEFYGIIRSVTPDGKLVLETETGEQLFEVKELQFVHIVDQ